MLSHVWALSGAASRQWEWPATQLAALRAVRSPQTESSGCERVRVAVPVRSGRGARYILYILWSDAGLLTGNGTGRQARGGMCHRMSMTLKPCAFTLRFYHLTCHMTALPCGVQYTLIQQAALITLHRPGHLGLARHTVTESETQEPTLFYGNKTNLNGTTTCHTSSSTIQLQ